ncbi:putative transcriptional regulator [Clostridium ljungdahlii DSM 13528]|nr:putative transcriptional regulator [Clostridium ljungdahlii DSM 13528]
MNLQNMKNKIRELRKERKITQEELADFCNVTRQTIISLENGKYNPSIFLAYKIAKIFNMTIEQVFIFEEEE